MNPFRSFCTKQLLALALLISLHLNTGYADDSGGQQAPKAPALQAGNSGSGDTVLPDLFTGTMSYKIPIDVPPGRNGMDPGLALLYRSSNGNGWVGVGWELEVGAIERSTKKGLKYDDNQDTFIFHMAGGVSELVYDSGAGFFRAKIEGGFNRYRRLTATDSKTYWEVTDKKGTVYRFGQAAATRQDDPTGTKIFKWCLDSATDTNGNYMTFSYVKDQGQIYLDQINYTFGSGLSYTNYVKFILDSASTDAPAMYTTNFAVTTAKRLSTIDVFANGNRVRRYRLTYSANGSASTGQSLLTSVQQFDGGGSSMLPAISFSYNSSDKNFNQPQPWLSNSGPTGDTYGPDFNFIGDFNGDGRLDFMYNRAGWYVAKAKSTGDGFDAPTQWLSNNGQYGQQYGSTFNFVGDFNGDGKVDLLYNYGGWYVAKANATGDGFEAPLPWLSNSGPTGDTYGPDFNFIGDFNGDGKLDFMYNRDGWYVAKAKSTGDGFDAPTQWLGNSGQYGQQYGPNFNFVGDFDGDGKVDIMYNYGGWYVARANATGDGFEAPLPWLGNSGPTGDTYGPNFNFIGDFNGDGKLDFMYNRNGWYVSLSTGNGFTYPQKWLDNFSPTGQQQYGPNFNFVGDFNGDGKLDLMYNYNGWYVALAKASGDGFSTPQLWLGNSGQYGQQYGPDFNYIGDFDGDGKLDYMYNYGGWYVAKGNGPSDLLVGINNGLGAATTVTYTPSTQYNNTRLPFPIQTISSVTTNDANGNNSAASYSYEGGYFYIPEKDFRGFSHVTVTGPAGSNGEKTVTETWFHQGNDTTVGANNPEIATGYMKGKPYKVRISAGSGNKYVETTTSYTSVSAGASYFNPPSEVITTLFNGSSTQGKQTRTVYASHDAYGNVLRTDQYGDYTNSNSDTTDDRTSTRTYGYNTTSWIVGLPTNETVYKAISTASGDKVASTYYYYDDLTDCSSTPSGSLTKGNLTRIVTWLDGGTNPEVRMAYNSYGNVTCRRDTNGNTSTIGYDATYTLPKTVTNPLGQQATTNYYGIDVSGNGLYGQVQSVTDVANNTTTSYEYDNFGRKTKTTLHDGSYSTISYNNLGTVGAQNIQTSTSAGLSSWTYFDGLGRIVLEKGTGPDGKTIAAQTLYDARGAVKQKSLPYFYSYESPKFTTYAYDPIGRVTNVSMPDGTNTRACYNDWATITIDANSHKKRTINDAYGRLKQVEEYAGTASSCDGGTLYATTTYTYDVLGNLRFVTDAKGNQSEMRYNTLGRKTYMHDPDMGNWSYYYDANGNMTSQLDSMNQWIYFQYDAMNRLLQKDYNNQKALGSGDIVYRYDETHTAYGKGRLTSIKDQSVSGIYNYNTRFYYDSIGQTFRVDKVVDGVNYTTQYGYDQLGRPNAVTYPDNTAVNYNYNGPLLSSVYEGSTTYAAFSGYNALGQPGTITYGNNVAIGYTYYNSANGACSLNNYRLCSIYTSMNGAVLQNMQYGYDNVGNIMSITDHTDNNQNHEADKIARLNALNSMTYGYPTNGIRPHAATSAGSNSYAYDNNGNMTTGAGRGITYDPENRPSTINAGGTATSFYYDGNGERVKKAVGSTATVYIAGLYECTGGTCTKYIFANGQRIAAKTAGNTLYFHPDHLGGSSVITDASGSQVEYIAYYPFGQTRIDSGSASVPYKYTGQELDDSTGLYNYNARLYDPVLGKFITADSIVPDPGDPQAFNRYSYVRNNPINLTDPSGHSWLSHSTGIDINIGSKETTALLYQNFSPTFLYGTYQLSQTEQGRSILAIEAAVAMVAVGYYGPEHLIPTMAGPGASLSNTYYTIAGFQVPAAVVDPILYTGATALTLDVLGAFRGGNGGGGSGGGIQGPLTMPSYYGPGMIGHVPLDQAIQADMGLIMGMTSPLGGGAKVLQTGGHTLLKSTLKKLGLSKGEGKAAIEALKKNVGVGNASHQKIMSDGDVVDSHSGDWLGNLFDYLR